jgi:hypothetical protein
MNVVPLPISVKLVCSVCGAEGKGSCRCNATYVPAGKRAAEAAAANPNKSAREIAKETGVGKDTVRRARIKSVGANAPPDRVIGKDGKSYPTKKRGAKAPGVKQAQRSIDLHPDVWAQVKARADAQGIPASTLIGQLLTASVDPEVDIKTLSKTAQEKLDAAIRQYKRKLDSEYDIRRTSEIDAHIKRIMPTLQAEKNAAYEREKTYREFLERQKKIFTPAEYKAVIRCLHPDSNPSSDVKAEAFRLFNAKKFALTGEK